MNQQDFLDIRSHGFTRVAVVIPAVALANPMANQQHHDELLNEAYKQGVMYACCPELGLTGYSCGDLFQSQVLQEQALVALELLVLESVNWPGMLVSVGLPLRVHDCLCNAAVTFSQGKILSVTPKVYPPNYREFYELRHFARATDIAVAEVTIAGETIPFGSRIALVNSEDRDFILHVEICEDLWVPVSPSSLAALAGATVLANLSASNSTLGKAAYRRQLLEASSGRNLAVQLYAAAGNGESTSDLSWDGHGIIAERGVILVEAKRFDRQGSVTVADVDLEAVVQDRLRQSSFRQNATDVHQGKANYRLVEWKAETHRHSEQLAALKRVVNPLPFVPADAKERDAHCREVFNIQVHGLARRLEALPADRRRIILGLSGGQDSTHALNVAAETCDRLGLPRTNIVGVTMPGFGTSTETYQLALQLGQAYGIEFIERPIVKLTEELFDLVGFTPGESGTQPIIFENGQAWSRMVTLFALSADRGGIVLGTGDLSELLVGWCTFGGDHLSHYGVNAGVGKTLISYLISWRAEQLASVNESVSRVLRDILSLDISPELQPLDLDGAIAQKTENIVGPYELIDFFGYYLIRFGFRPMKLVRMALTAFGEKYTIGELVKWLRVFLIRFFQSQFKRNCLPDGPKVGGAAVSPRGDWRMPSDAKPDAWLFDLDRVPLD